MARVITLPIVLVTSLLLPAYAPAATITGTVVVASEGRAAKRPDQAGVIVWLEPAGGVVTPAASGLKTASMGQRNETFIPHVLAIAVGTAVDFPNDDPIFHNVFSNYAGQVFDLQLYAPQTSRRVVFRRPGMVHVFCNIHENMSAVIAVLPTPYFAVTGADGRFAIEAPPGEYRLQVWHERATAEMLTKMARPLTVASQGAILPDAQLTVSSVPVPPHKNKYGHDYAPRPTEHVFYPGARR